MSELEELLNLFTDAVPVVNPRYWAEAKGYVAEEYHKNPDGMRNSIIIADYYPTVLQDDDGEAVYIGFRERKEEGTGE